jgi:hypothetical protein
MAYNFYQNQKQVSFGLQSQISGLQESIEQQGKEQFIDRQSQISQLSQAQDVEKTEEQSQVKQLQAAGVASLVEGGVLGIPALKNVAGLVKKGVDTFQKTTEAVEGLKSTATEAVSTIKQSATKITSNLGDITDTLSSNLKEAVLENPLTGGISASSFDTPTNIFQKPTTSVLTDTEKAIQEQTQALNQYRTPAPEQFGENINMEGRQMSDIPTAVLPTDKPALAETSFGLETPSINPISGNKIAMSAEGEITPIVKVEAPIAKAAPVAEAPVEEATETVAKKSRGFLGTLFGDIGEGIADILDPVADIATAGLAIYSTVKGVEDEKAKPEAIPSQPKPPPLPEEQIPADIQSTAQVGI